MHNPMRTAMMMTAALAMMAPAFISGEMASLPALPAPRPEGYGVHLSKAERKGKSVAELQALRAERMNA
jgi:hypothetical protein